ncbi:MAG: peptide chain release factor 3, partial [Lachnospiraceae bacterium]|nr:peptide chain release factor 3 [Lachnospiraceae bacterium]
SKYAVSDWMEIERERGISVTSSVLQFNYDGYCINILDTPGHQDFSEDTYRTLMAADSAVMVIDASKGVEAQTIKLFKVCVMRHIPIFTFINKMDRDARDTFELLDDIETVLGIHTCPMNWPIGSGKEFKGVYDRRTKKVATFQAISTGGAKKAMETEYNVEDEDFKELAGPYLYEQFAEEIELIDGATDELDLELVRKGELSPVFFGSALNTFGIDMFLNYFLEMTTSPLGRQSTEGMVNPLEEPFSAFVFKIQANMNKAHRDRIAFMRICSGKFEAGMEVYHVPSKRKIKLSQPQQLMAQDRKMVEEAYAGDVIGVFDPDLFAIGDTLTVGAKYEYEAIPTFAPEHFARLVNLDSMKRKQFMKGVTQIAQEGAIQMFQEFTAGMSEIIVGVVGVLQFEVLKYRLENEYGCEIRLETIPYTIIRWVKDTMTDLTSLKRVNDVKKVKDMKGNPLLLFKSEWAVNNVLEYNEGLELMEFRKD